MLMAEQKLKQKLKGLSLNHELNDGAYIYAGNGICVALGFVDVWRDHLDGGIRDKIVGLYVTGLPNFDPNRRYTIKNDEILQLCPDFAIGLAESDKRNLENGMANYRSRATLTYDIPREVGIVRLKLNGQIPLFNLQPYAVSPC
jgi:hypothetical protein